MQQAEPAQHPVSCFQPQRVFNGDPIVPSITQEATCCHLSPSCFTLQLWELDSILLHTTTYLSRFADDTKLSGVVDTPGGLDAIQRDLDKLKEWVHGNLMRSNKTKCKVLHLGQVNPCSQSRLGDEQMESSPPEDLGVQVGVRLDMTQQRALSAQRAKHVLGCIQSPVGSRGGRGFCPSALLL
ncbi:hypothetical protein HGM15179_010602 [Zosterops borbonicus]|uniref:Rna-directed dna polymerase from mobile element jockey-like n=1 Tax=Zosterops borbonicus TaxID=364589 RepID=A0A8K1LJS3_9PASS|nr:hypothetical protein HGM15179_010602 [Zosterops borbonicus]